MSDDPKERKTQPMTNQPADDQPHDPGTMAGDEIDPQQLPKPEEDEDADEDEETDTKEG